MISPAPLFTPFTIKNVTLANRIVMSPMTRNFSPNGIPGDDVAAYYRRRAENGVGLIITEGTAPPHAAASSSPSVPHLYGEAALAGWGKVVSAVHSAGGKIFSQIWHVGALRKPGDLPNPEVPPVGASMAEAEIETVIRAYAEAAANAKKVGFDGIELHGAHGYLIDQFFWDRTNQRTDGYGGDFVARTRFATEAIKACRDAVGPDYVIQFRFSQWKIVDYSARLVNSPDELARFLEPLTDAGVDIFDCSSRRYADPEFEGSHLNLAGWTKKLTGKPVITVGSVGLDPAASLDTLIEMVQHSEIDLVAVGRALLGDFAWARKIREGLVPSEFTQDALKTLT